MLPPTDHPITPELPVRARVPLRHSCRVLPVIDRARPEAKARTEPAARTAASSKKVPGGAAPPLAQMVPSGCVFDLFPGHRNRSSMNPRSVRRSGDSSTPPNPLSETESHTPFGDPDERLHPVVNGLTPAQSESNSSPHAWCVPLHSSTDLPGLIRPLGCPSEKSRRQIVAVTTPGSKIDSATARGSIRSRTTRERGILVESSVCRLRQQPVSPCLTDARQPTSWRRRQCRTDPARRRLDRP